MLIKVRLISISVVGLIIVILGVRFVLISIRGGRNPKVSGARANLVSRAETDSSSKNTTLEVDLNERSFDPLADVSTTNATDPSSTDTNSEGFSSLASDDKSTLLYEGLSQVPKLYAFYFPQFHEDFLNNELWGQGFTEWDRLRKAPKTNRFGDPILQPIDDIADYDLLDINIRRWQGDTAKQYGIDGFIYHAYWFYGSNSSAPDNIPLAKPLLQMLRDNEPNISFCLHWANDDWTHTWSGFVADVPNGRVKRRSIIRTKYGGLLHEQHYPTDPNDPLIVEHYQYLRQFFHHPNYIKVDNEVPLFMAFKSEPHLVENGPGRLRALRMILGKLKQLAMNDGFPYPGLHIPQSLLNGLPSYPATVEHAVYDSIFYYPFTYKQPEAQFNLVTYCDQVRDQIPNYLGSYTTFDNTPRRNLSSATILHRKYTANVSAAQSFYFELVDLILLGQCCPKDSVGKTGRVQRGANMIVINAWNEWGEGMVLEPSKQLGYSFLHAVLKAKAFARERGCDFAHAEEIAASKTIELKHEPMFNVSAGRKLKLPKYRNRIERVKAPSVDSNGSGQRHRGSRANLTATSAASDPEGSLAGRAM